ncbi:MAG: hypothetical protein AAF378_18210 [Cyanobacteria bacterium P01_A01_bin.84]
MLNTKTKVVLKTTVKDEGEFDALRKILGYLRYNCPRDRDILAPTAVYIYCNKRKMSFDAPTFDVTTTNVTMESIKSTGVLIKYSYTNQLGFLIPVIIIAIISAMILSFELFEYAFLGEFKPKMEAILRFIRIVYVSLIGFFVMKSSNVAHGNNLFKFLLKK